MRVRVFVIVFAWCGLLGGFVCGCVVYLSFVLLCVMFVMAAAVAAVFVFVIVL